MSGRNWPSPTSIGPTPSTTTHPKTAADAETGAALNVGDGTRLHRHSHRAVAGRAGAEEVVHQADGFSERGMSLSFGRDPTPSSPLGLTAKVAPSWGGQARGGAETLRGNQMAYGMGRDLRMGYSLRLLECSQPRNSDHFLTLDDGPR